MFRTERKLISWQICDKKGSSHSLRYRRQRPLVRMQKLKKRRKKKQVLVHLLISIICWVWRSGVLPKRRYVWYYFCKPLLLTKNLDQIEKLNAQSREKQEELLRLLELTPIQIWNTDLDNYLMWWKVRFSSTAAANQFAYSTFKSACNEWEEKAIKDSKGKVVKRKQATLKTRKSLTGGSKFDNEEDDDDYKPSKITAKASAPKQEKKPARPKAGLSSNTKDGWFNFGCVMPVLSVLTIVYQKKCGPKLLPRKKRTPTMTSQYRKRKAKERPKMS